VLMFKKSFIEQRPEDVEKVLTALFKALNIRTKNPTAAYAIMAKATGVPAGSLKGTISGNIFPDLEQNKKFFEETNDLMSLFHSGKIISAFFMAKGVISSPIDLEELHARALSDLIMKIAFKILSGYLAISILLIAMRVLVIHTYSVLNPVIDELDKEVNSLKVALTFADLTYQIELLKSNLRYMATLFYFTRQPAQVEKYERTTRELERVFEQINLHTLQVTNEDDRKIISNLQLSTNRLAKFERRFMLLAKENQPASYKYLTRNSECQQLNKSISNFITSYSFSRKLDSTDVFSRLVTISDSIQSSKVELNLRSKITLLIIALVSIVSLLIGVMVARWRYVCSIQYPEQGRDK